jgi:predicted RecB family nuclease
MAPPDGSGADAVPRAPLGMVEGIENHDRLRLEELGIDTCYDLATADFVPLVLRMPYSALQLIDWILQAK